MLRSLCFLFVAACAADPVLTAPVDQSPIVPGVRVALTRVVPGETTSFGVSGLSPGALVGIAVGAVAGPGPCPTAWNGTCFDIDNVALLGTTRAGAAGFATLDVSVPASVQTGQDLYFQAFELAGPNTVASNVTSDVSTAPLALSGFWDDNFGGTHDITSRAWFNFGTFRIWWFDNADQTAVALNGPDTFFPGAFSRFDWTVSGGSTWYCQTAYNAPSYAAAYATPRADDTSPASGGCSGFSWTQLTPAP